MDDIETASIIGLVKLKRESPGEYEEFIGDMKVVMKDIANASKKVPDEVVEGQNVEKENMEGD